MILHDLRSAVRYLTRRPAFALTGIALLALGAGANAAVFSMVRGVLLRPLPFTAPHDLVAVWPDAFVSNDEVAFWRERAHGLAAVASISPGWLMALAAGDEPAAKITAAKVSDNLFATLGVHAALGRALAEGDSAPGRTLVAVVSDRLWRQRFGSDPAVLGRVVLLDQAPYEVVGVLPPGIDLFGRADLWIPSLYAPGSPQHRQTSALVVGRLSAGTDVDSASRELAGLVPELRRELGRPEDWGRTVRAVPLAEAITGSVRPALVLLLGAVGCVLLLGAINLATLVLGGSIARMRELAVRTAVGASKARLVRQLLLEQAALATSGSLAGLGLAAALFPWLVTQVPADVPRRDEIALDWPVFTTIALATVGLSLLLALAPALVAQRSGLEPLLRRHAGTVSGGRHRVLGGLVSAQVAVALILGIGASLMLRSLWNLQHVDPGFDATRVLTFRLQTTSAYQSLRTGVPYLRRAMERLGAVPGVTAVGAINHLPMSGYSWTTNVYRPEHPPVPGTQAPLVAWRFTAGDYFEAMRIPVRAGRVFIDTDTAAAAGVAMVNETLARQMFGSVPAAIGQRLIQQGGGRPGPFEVQIVGVVGDVRHVGLDRPPAPEIYRPLQQTFMFPMQVVVRASGDPAPLPAAVRAAVSEVDRSVPVADLQTLGTVLYASLGRSRLVTYLLSIFAAIGVLLSVVGLYGVVALGAAQRTREIGIRMALGATPRAIAGAVVRQGVGHAAAGLLAGVPVAWLSARVMDRLVFGIAARDPITFLVLPCLIVVVTLAACYLPARRACRVDAVEVIRGAD